MKKILFALVSFCALLSCNNESVEPSEPDPFIGTWSYEDSYSDIDLSVDFSVVNKGNDYTFNNIKLEYSEIPSTETLSYEVKLRDPYAAGDGFRLIQFIATWTTTCPNGLVCDKWIFVDFNNTKIYKKVGSTQYVMSVEAVDVLMINKEELVLENQEVSKTSL